MRRLLSGLAHGADASHELAAAVADLHPKNDTFPGEVFMELAGDAFDVADISRDNWIPYEGLREAHLPDGTHAAEFITRRGADSGHLN